MASPQAEFGHTRIANELLCAWIAAPLTQKQYKITAWIFRNTYGWSRKVTKDWSVRKIANSILSNPGNVHRALTELRFLAVVKIHSNTRSIGINKDYESWGMEAIKLSTTKECGPKGLLPLGNESVACWQQYRCLVATKVLPSGNISRTRAKRKKERKERKQADGTGIDKDLGITAISHRLALENRMQTETQLLNMKIKFGSHKHLAIQSLDVDYCRRILNGKPGRKNMSETLVKALDLRIRQHEEDINR